MSHTTIPANHTAEFGADHPSMTVGYCACALCQPKTQSDISACHAGMSDEEREEHIKGFDEDAKLYKAIAGISDDPAYWCAQAFKATQARDALIAGRK